MTTVGAPPENPATGATGPRAERSWVALLLVYLGFGATIAVVWARLTDKGGLPSWHSDMLHGLAPAPNQYRLLAPYLAEAIRSLLPGHSLLIAYAALRGMITGVTLFCFDRYLRTWFTPSAAAAGALCLAAILPFTFLRVVQESDPINLLCFVLAFWALARGRDLVLIPLVLVGTLNRETVALIPALYLITRWGRERPRRLVWRTAALAASWVAVYGGLLLHYGWRRYYCDVYMLPTNLTSVEPILVFGAIWVLAFMARRQGPEMLQRCLWVVPFFVLLQYTVAIAWETRLYLPLAPILIPLAWTILFPRDYTANDRQPAPG